MAIDSIRLLLYMPATHGAIDDLNGRERNEWMEKIKTSKTHARGRERALFP